MLFHGPLSAAHEITRYIRSPMLHPPLTHTARTLARPADATSCSLAHPTGQARMPSTTCPAGHHPLARPPMRRRPGAAVR
jgi:hypothetical protein